MKYRDVKQNDVVQRIKYSNPGQRSSREIVKLKADFVDLTLAAKYLDLEEEHGKLFDKNSLSEFVLAVLDVSRREERKQALNDQIDKMNSDCYRDMNNEPETKKKVEISDDYNSRREKIKEDEAFHSKIDLRRVETAAAMVAVCLDYCYEQIEIVEPDPNIRSELFQKTFDLTKRLTESIVGKVRSSHEAPSVQKR